MKKLGLTLLGAVCFFLLVLLTGIVTKQDNEINDLQAQIEEQQELLQVQQEQLEMQQDYIEEVHSYINDYTYNESGTVFIYIDDEGNHYD